MEKEIRTHHSILDPISLSYCGQESENSRFKFNLENDNVYMIQVITSGKGACRIGKKVYELEKDQAILICPGTEAVFQSARKSQLECCWIAFQGFKAEYTVENIGFSKQDPVVDLDNTEEVVQEMQLLMDAKKNTYAEELKRMSLLYSVFNFLVEGSRKKKEKKEHEDASKMYVRMAVDRIMNSYDKKIRIADIADDIGINRSYLTNIFKKEMQMSPQDFLIGVRLEKAAQLLGETDDPIRAVAYCTGYDDSLSFSKAFKQKYHMTPSAYRQMAG